MHWKYGKKEKRQNMGNGCGSVGRAVAYDTRGPHAVINLIN